MKNIKLLASVAAIGTAFVSFDAQAGMVTDAHGNVGYDTAAECDAAVLAGNAKFYQSFTHKPALKRAGEASVQVATVKDLGQQYRLGACDMGVGHKLGRDGVSKALQGKFIPFSPDMPVNVYSDASGRAVRVSMKQCDNWFSGNAPRPVAIPAPKPVAAAPVVAPVVAAAPVAVKSGVRPYVFGTAGVLRDGVRITDSADGSEILNDKNTEAAGQVGLGLQFNDLLGAEVFYQGADKNDLHSANRDVDIDVHNNTYGIRATVGTEVAKNLRVFGKAGVAGVQHKYDGSDTTSSYSKTKAQATAGVGATYDVTDNLSVRADYDHYFKRSSNKDLENGVDWKWKGADYMGIGAQYKF